MRQFLATVAVIAACAAAGWWTFETSREVGPPRDGAFRRDEPPLTVEVMKPVIRSVVDRVEVVGSLEAGAAIDVRGVVPGYVAEVLHEVGDPITAGEPLLRLDETEAVADVTQAESDLRVARKELEAEQARVRFAKVELDQWESLAATGVATGQRLDEAKSELALAEATAAVAAARVASAEAAIERATSLLDRVTIKAPFDGLVAVRDVDPGDLATTDRTLMRVIAIDVVRTVVSVGERDYAKVTVGTPAEVRVDAYPDRFFDGVVVRVAPILDERTRSGDVEVDIANPKGLLKPGMTARVTLTLGERPDVTVVPVASLMEAGGRTTLMVVDGDPPAAAVREVVPGVSDGDVVEIADGLEPGDRVVTLGNHVASAGDAVKPVEVAGLLPRRPAAGR